MKIAVVGGGIAGLAAARELEHVLPEAEIVLLERTERLGGKVRTEREEGYVVEGGADSFLSRKPRGVGLAQELGLELVGRRPENARSFVRVGADLEPLPEGLTGMIPTNLEALADTELLSPPGRERLAAEPGIPPAPPGGDESIASFVTRRLGREAYERLVEPLMTGIYGGDGDQLSLQATFPNLRALELEHGSLLRGLAAQPPAGSARPPFLSFRTGMETLVSAVAGALRRTQIRIGVPAVGLSARDSGYELDLDGETLEADGVVLAIPAFEVVSLIAGQDDALAAEHAQIPYASAAIVTFALDDAGGALDGYGYVIPHTEHDEVLACTWSSSKWEGRAPDGSCLVRVYLGRFAGRDVTEREDDDLLDLARQELRLVGLAKSAQRVWIHRWPRGMPQYVLGHPERLARIHAALAEHPGLALAGAAYRGVGVPDCIHSGEEAARSVARSLAGVP